MAKGNSRPDRWAKAVKAGQDALEAMEEHKQALADAFEELEGLRSEYEEWHGNLPENLQQTALGEKLEAVVGMDFSWTADDDDLSAARDALGEAENADLPRGFGKD